ncbi:MAG TPA: alpha/beta hydrolase [Gemmataceae bacterium]|nr:alpha/beta hydrolase [Gemmataceae bacterium]
MGKPSWKQRCSHLLALAALRQPAFWERSWKHRLGRILIYFAIAYLAVLIAVLMMEDLFLYGPREVELGNPPTGVEIENVEMTSRRGDRIHAWWSKAKDWRPEQGAVLFCHGNGGNLSYRGRVLTHWIKEMGVAVLIFDYPGYGRSSGEPSEDGCYAAGDATYDWLRQVAKVPAERILLYGGSLGGGIATDLAMRRPHRALILVATFTSIPDMAQSRFPWLPGRWLVRHQFNNIEKLAHCRGPVFIAHCPEDDLIPFVQGEHLFAAAPEPKCFFPMPNYHHNDLPTAEFYPALRRFLADCFPNEPEA